MLFRSNAVADGGNLLLNIGPMANGEVPREQLERIQDIGAWLDINGSAIFDTRPYAISRLVTTNGQTVRLTQDQDNNVYAIVLGDSPDVSISIENLPDGNVSLLGHSGSLVRHGNTVNFPPMPRKNVAFVLRIAQ